MDSFIKPVLINPKAKHTATVIFLHGLGDTGRSWPDELRTIIPDHAKLICPTAAICPVTINGGARMPSWFDISSLDKDNVDEDVEGIKKASRSIIEIIQSEINGAEGKPGIPGSRIVLGGISQGGALALYTGLTGTVALGGIISLSGYLPIPSTIEWDSINTPRVLQCHGDSDSLISYEFAIQSSQYFKQYLPQENYDFKVYKGLEHWICPKELDDVKQFLKQTIPSVK